MDNEESDIEERKSDAKLESRKTNKLPWTHLIKINKNFENAKIEAQKREIDIEIGRRI